MKNFYLFILSIILQGISKVKANHHKEKRGLKMAPFDKIWKVNLGALKAQEKETFENKEEKNIPELFEGDIVMTEELNRTIEDMKYAFKTNSTPYDAIRGGQWPNGVVPYTFASGFVGQNIVYTAIKHYSQHVPCIKWKPRSNERQFVTFFHGGGCYSMIGRQGGPQRISLANPGCLHLGVAVHEMMHCLGFYHEQSRRDRDNYVIINWRNMNQRMKYNFEKYRYGKASTLGEPYDKKSVMHYGNYAFSINRRMTIVSKSNRNERLGQRRGLSRIDINQLKKYYKCSGTTASKKNKKSSCKDDYAFCTVFAISSNRNWCESTWVSKYCKLSCEKCPKPPITKPTTRKTCTDKDKNCPKWKDAGYCKERKNLQYKAYMELYCKGSCPNHCQ